MVPQYVKNRPLPCQYCHKEVEKYQKELSVASVWWYNNKYHIFVNI